MDGPWQKRKNVLGGWNPGVGGCRGDVIGPEQEASEKQVSLFILILFAVPAGKAGGGDWQSAKARAAGKWQRMPSRPQRQHQKLTSLFSETWCAAKGLISAPWHDYTGCRPTTESLLPPARALSLSLYAPSLGALSFSTAFKSFPPNMQQLPWRRRMEHKEVSNESSLDTDVPHVYPF